MWVVDVPEPEEGSEEQLDPVPLMDRSCVANVLEKVKALLFGDDRVCGGMSFRAASSAIDKFDRKWSLDASLKSSMTRCRAKKFMAPPSCRSLSISRSTTSSTRQAHQQRTGLFEPIHRCAGIFVSGISTRAIAVVCSRAYFSKSLSISGLDWGKR